MQAYFDAWQTGPEQKILAYFSDDVTLQLPTELLKGKAEVRDQFVRPFYSEFPSNMHKIRSIVYGESLVPSNGFSWRCTTDRSIISPRAEKT
jgi:hypothetical protein